MRPTKKPSKYYDISDAEGKKGQALKWDIPAEAVTRDGEYINNTMATAVNVADSPASAAAVASSESKSDAVSAAMSASTVSVVVESVAIV